MITALLVSFVVLALAVAAVSLSIHNLEESSYDRRRVQAVAAAEAGVDYYFSHVASVASGAIQCNVTGTVGSGPGTFTVTPSFYTSAGSPLSCPLTADPAWVLVNSTGRAKANTTPARTLQAYVRLTPGSTAPFDNRHVLRAYGDITFRANTQVGGSQYNDADIYVDGNMTLSANSVVHGNLYVQGNVTMGSGAEAKKTVHAGGWLSMGGNSRVGRSGGNAIASGSSITMSGAQTRVYGDATAATTNTGGTVDGQRLSSTPTTPPAAEPYPTFNYLPTDWTNAGYIERTYSNDCTTAVSDIGNWFGAGSGSYVVHVTGGCAMTFTSSVTVRGHLAIVTDGSVALNTPARFTPASGTGPWNVHIFAGLAGAVGCNFTANTNTGFDSGLKTMIYTHQNCTSVFDSNSALAEGQVISGSIDFKKSTAFKFTRVAVPGTPSGGLTQDVVYKREIIPTTTTTVP